MVAKKRKPTAKTTALRRTSRRGKNVVNADAQAAAAKEPEPSEITTDQESTSSETPITTNDELAISDPQTSQMRVAKPNVLPVIALHKKFGKYRCLFNNEDSYIKKYEVSSDSENSSVEVRVVDPCASSESDSNTAIDSQSDTNSQACNSPLNIAGTTMQINSRNSSPYLMLKKIKLPNQSSVSKRSNDSKKSVKDIEPHVLNTEMQNTENHDVQMQPEMNQLNDEPNVHRDEVLSWEVINESSLSKISKDLDNISKKNKPHILKSEMENTENHDVQRKPEIDQLNDKPCFAQREEEMLRPNVTVDNVKITEINADPIETNDIPIQNAGIPIENLESIDENTPVTGDNENQMNQDIPYETLDYSGDDVEVITIVQIVEDDNPDVYYDIKIDSPGDQSKTDNNQGTSREREFQKHFERLNLSHIDEASSPMDCSEQQDNASNLSILNDSSSEILLRPEPSLTPSSTLSDDSNSSRATENHPSNSNDSTESSPTGVRRSNRIKTISSLKQKTKGYGLVKTPLKKALITQTKLKLEEMGSNSLEKPLEISMPNSPLFPVPSELPVKVKSRWRRSSELEMGVNSPIVSPLASPSLPSSNPANVPAYLESQPEVPLSEEAYDKIIDERMKQYEHLDENVYMCERMISKETKKMICDCFLTKEEIDRGELGCGEDCLNRLLMIECNSRCPVGDRCTNRRFQKIENAPLKVFYADKKGCGVETSVDMPSGEFLMEYVGEVLDYEQFYKRAQAYSEDNNLHHYFMSLKGETVIDATLKGNISRFINHSCEPNAETQKWTVNGELRIGFFSKRDLTAGEEITFDYQFKRFGKVAQRCYCGANNCRGWIGGEPDSEDEDDEEDDISTSKGEGTESSEPASESTPAPTVRPRRPKRDRRLKSAPELVLDADIEEELDALRCSGVKNQSHTLSLSRMVVRAKTRRAQTALLRLLRDADLPCRRLFLDYRGLRLLAPWALDAPLDYKLEMLQTIDRLPIPNKTMVQESRFFTIVERWLNAAESGADIAVFIDEATGLPVDMPNRTEDSMSPEKAKETSENVKELCKQLLERWSSLKEVFKIPKKERIQQMKEHERQANVERRAADSSGTRDRNRDRDRDRERERDRDRERDREREKEREREREREKERDKDRDRHRERDRERDRERARDRERDDRDRRKRRSSPDTRRSLRLNDRVLTAVPPMSKEERRRAFAEAAAAADESRRQQQQRPPPPPWHPAHPPPYWQQPDAFQQMYPPGMMPSGNMLQSLPGMPAGLMPPALVPGVVPDMPPEWIGPNGEFQGPPGFCPQFAPQSFCMPQPNMMGMMGVAGYVFPQQLTGPPPPHPANFPAHPTAAVDIKQPKGEGDAPVPAALLPSQWRSATDPHGRTYYYHVKLRVPQWQPPTPPPPPSPDESSSEEDDEQMNALATAVVRRQGKLVEGVDGIYEVIKEKANKGLIPDHALVSVKPKKRRPGLVTERPISPRTAEDKLAGKMEIKRYRQTKEKLRRRRERLLSKVRALAATHHSTIHLKAEDIETGSESGGDSDEPVEMIESTATTDDAAVEAVAPVEAPVLVEEVESLKETVEPVEATTASRRKSEKSGRKSSEKGARKSSEMSVEAVAESARRIKEQFRSSMARVMVHHLNPYRHREAPAGRITNTNDFKHLARKLTHFVMLKELKHCRSVEELVVTESVRSKAKEFVKKYMAKFGPVYKRPAEEVE